MYNLSLGWTKRDGVELSMFVLNTQKHNCPNELIEQEFEPQHLVSSKIDTTIKPWEALSHILKNKNYNISRFDKESLKSDLKNLLKKEQFDIIHFEGLFVAPLLATAKKYNPTAKLVLRAHNIEHIIWKRQSEAARGLKKWYLNQLASTLHEYENEIVPQFDAIVPITSIDAQYFKEFNKPLFVSSTGMILKDLPKNHKISPLKVFHLGSLDWSPNIEAMHWFLNLVWPLVTKVVPQAQFYIAGKNITPEIENLNISNVSVVGEVPDASAFMQNHGIMVVPLQSGSGMRIKIVEGMANGCPIVTTSVGIEGINYSEEAVSVHDSPSDFANALIRLLTDEELSLNAGKSARKIAEEEYSNTHKVAELTQFYKSLLQ